MASAPVGGVSRFVSSKAHFGKGSESGQEREGKSERGRERREEKEGEERTRKKERERERKRMLFLCTAVACSTRCHVTGALHSVTSRGHSVIDQLEGAVNPLTTRLFVPLRYHDLLHYPPIVSLDTSTSSTEYNHNSAIFFRGKIQRDRNFARIFKSRWSRFTNRSTRDIQGIPSGILVSVVEQTR